MFFDHGYGSTYFCLEPKQARLTQNRDLMRTLMRRAEITDEYTLELKQVFKDNVF